MVWMQKCHLIRFKKWSMVHKPKELLSLKHQKKKHSKCSLKLSSGVHQRVLSIWKPILRSIYQSFKKYLKMRKVRLLLPTRYLRFGLILISKYSILSTNWVNLVSFQLKPNWSGPLTLSKQESKLRRISQVVIIKLSS